MKRQYHNALHAIHNFISIFIDRFARRLFDDQRTHFLYSDHRSSTFLLSSCPRERFLFILFFFHIFGSIFVLNRPENTDMSFVSFACMWLCLCWLLLIVCLDNVRIFAYAPSRLYTYTLRRVHKHTHNNGRVMFHFSMRSHVLWVKCSNESRI